MKTLSDNELEAASGGINILGAANLFRTEQWGPLGMAFTAGYAFGTFIYNNWDSARRVYSREPLSLEYEPY
jgi:hypothetical protein